MIDYNEESRIAEDEAYDERPTRRELENERRLDQEDEDGD